MYWRRIYYILVRIRHTLPPFFQQSTQRMRPFKIGAVVHEDELVQGGWIGSRWMG
jgi:hypothetical protein